jgi:hypothetical protein
MARLTALNSLVKAVQRGFELTDEYVLHMFVEKPETHMLI